VSHLELFVVHRWRSSTGPEGSSPTIEDFVGRSFHPLVSKWIPTQDNRIPGDSELVKAYKVDYLIEQHEIFLARLWAAVAALDDEHGFSSDVTIALKLLLNPVLDMVRSLRASSLPKDFCSRAALPFGSNRLLETSVAIYGREAMIDKLESDVALMAYRSKDPSPCFLEKKWQLIQQLLELKHSQKEDGMEGVCVEREIFYLIQESFIQLDKVNQLTSGDEIDRSRRERAAMRLQTLTLYRLESMGVCNATWNCRFFA
jgi:hypothetical protein